jgi:hypothetical protein
MPILLDCEDDDGDNGLGMLLNMMYRVSYTAPRYDTVLYYLDTPKLCL